MIAQWIRYILGAVAMNNSADYVGLYSITGKRPRVSGWALAYHNKFIESLHSDSPQLLTLYGIVALIYLATAYYLSLSRNTVIIGS